MTRWSIAGNVGKNVRAVRNGNGSKPKNTAKADGKKRARESQISERRGKREQHGQGSLTLKGMASKAAAASVRQNPNRRLCSQNPFFSAPSTQQPLFARNVKVRVTFNHRLVGFQIPPSATQPLACRYYSICMQPQLRGMALER